MDKLGCRYLPAEEEDTRPNQIRNKSGKKKYILWGLEFMIQSKQGNNQLFGVKNKENNYKKQLKRVNINLVALFDIDS